ncbi:unnamed protein product [Rotaria sp. Silwood2]|nr:unnamed protein product [Rotaria sp. Silwood2]
MYLDLFIFFCSLVLTGAKHFNGGTIRWAPIDPYDNSTSINITITQSYSWTFPYIKCLTNVPASTSGWSTANTNLSCIVDCTTDGGYSSAPIDILTDCTSSSASLKMMTSERSKDVTLSADAHFYIAYRGNAWRALNSPVQSNLDWSIVTFIDLRKRPDGFINTPPVATIISPQYANVNQTIQINIPVSDANVGDDVRCRWSIFTTGFRRRKRSSKEEHFKQRSDVHFYKEVAGDREFLHMRKKRQACSSCNSVCAYGCDCTCSPCISTTCINTNCTDITGCTATVGTTTTMTTTSTITDNSTDTETPGTPASTSSYPIRQAIDECAGICYPDSLPKSTTLSDCTITFKGRKVGVWYAVAIQVEDFISTTSTTPMSSIPVQFLIYVQPQPSCLDKPIIFPLTRCLEVKVGVVMKFNLSVMNLCNSNVATIADIFVSVAITVPRHLKQQQPQQRRQQQPQRRQQQLPQQRRQQQPQQRRQQQPQRRQQQQPQRRQQQQPLVPQHLKQQLPQRRRQQRPQQTQQQRRQQTQQQQPQQIQQQQPQRRRQQQPLVLRHLKQLQQRRRQRLQRQLLQHQLHPHRQHPPQRLPRPLLQLQRQQLQQQQRQRQQQPQRPQQQQPQRQRQQQPQQPQQQQQQRPLQPCK